MAARSKQPQPESPQDVARGLATGNRLDRDKVRRASRQASKAADRLVKEMDEVLKRLERRG